MRQFCLSALIAGLRGRSFITLVILGFFGMGLVLFTGLFSSRQPDTLSLDIGFSMIRFIGILMALFWVQELISKEIDRKYVFFSLAYPVPRNAYLIGRYLGVVVLLAIAILVLALQMGLAVWAAQLDYKQAKPVDYGSPVVLSLVFIWIELALIAAVSTSLAAISTAPLLPFALGACFSIITHSIGPVLDYVKLEQNRNPSEFVGVAPILDSVRWILPDTSRLDLRIHALYGTPINFNEIMLPSLMAVAYILFILGLGALYFHRREFS